MAPFIPAFGDLNRYVQRTLLAYRLAHLIWSVPPMVRLAIVEAIEETGNVLCALKSRLAASVRRDAGTELRYCGEFHFLLVSGHAMNNDHAEMAGITLDAEPRAKATECVDDVSRHSRSGRTNCWPARALSQWNPGSGWRPDARLALPAEAMSARIPTHRFHPLQTMTLCLALPRFSAIRFIRRSP